MNTATTTAGIAPPRASPRPNLDRRPGPLTAIIFVGLLAAGLLIPGYSLFTDVTATDHPVTTFLPFFLLGIALLIALGFEFVNGFHDTANAVATVIYTHSLPPQFAVVWSGCFNFLGVLVSSGAVAFGIISLLPVELILQVGSSAGFAMVFALLIAAIIWNFGTWWLGLPASSSHTLIGSIIGVGVANALMHGRDGTTGVDWAQATKVGYSLLLSPLVGFCCAALLLLALRALVKTKELYSEPKGNKPPPWWIRGILILTCTGVSFAHGLEPCHARRPDGPIRRGGTSYARIPGQSRAAVGAGGSACSAVGIRAHQGIETRVAACSCCHHRQHRRAGQGIWLACACPGHRGLERA